MAPAPWTQRLTAACAGLVLACALLAPPPSLAAPAHAGDAPAREIAAGGSLFVGVVPSAPKRGADGTLVSLRVLAAPEPGAAAAGGFGSAQAGGEAPTLTRWRLAHGTSTSSP